MNQYLFLADIVLSILDTSLVDPTSKIIAEDFASIEEKMELFNAILIPHQKRYLSCFSPDMYVKEAANFASDYQSVFINNKILFIEMETAMAIFRFVSTFDMQGSIFREVCIHLVEELKKCTVKEVINSMCSKLIHKIIGGALYGSEPYDSLLRDSTKLLRASTSASDTDKFVGILE